MPPLLPDSLDEFVDRVIPVRQGEDSSKQLHRGYATWALGTRTPVRHLGSITVKESFK